MTHEPLRRVRWKYPATRSPYALRVVDDGNAIHYSAVSRGTPVYAADGTEVGTVEQVVDNYREHILDGIVLQTTAGDLRFVDGPEVGRTAERGVTLAIGPDGDRGPATTGIGPGHLPDPTSAAAGCRASSGAPGSAIRLDRGGYSTGDGGRSKS